MNEKPVLKNKVKIDIEAELKKGLTKQQVVDQMDDHDEDNDGIDEDYDYVKVKSTSSCKLVDIKGFTFGGFSSRFWMLRKHINSMDRETLKTVPFFCWDCIVLEK